MGSDLPMAQDFYKMHCQLLEDLGKRGDEIDEALSVLSGTIMEITDERQRIAQKKHIEDRVDALRDSWLDCRHTVEARLHLSALYVDFHEAAVALGKELDEVESEFKKHSDNAEEGRIDDLEKRWNELRPLYMRLTSAGSAFLAEADRCTDAYLDILRARLCVETTLERFANRQLTVTESWENWQTSVVTTRERRIEQERRFEETTKTLAWATKFGEQLYPIITSESIKPSVILQDLESTQLGILPELKKAVTELDARIKSVESFTNGDDNVSERIKEKLSKVYEHLRTTATDYQNLLESLISIFDDLVQIENKTEEVNEIRKNLEQSSGFLTESGRDEVRMKAETINKIRDAITEVLKNVEPAIDQVISRIRTQEPAEAAVQETEKLNLVFNITSANWENACMEAKFKFDKRLLFCNFADDLDRIDADLMHLSDQLAGSAESGHRFTGDSLPAAEAASSAFLHFEKTVTILEERIKVFIKSTENNFELTTPESAPMINRELLKLQERWDELKRLSESTRERINSSIEYFRLLEEAKNWYRDGNKLMIVIARKSSSAKTPEEVQECLTGIEGYLKPGEELQEQRIEKIRDLSTRIFGTDRLPQFNEVVVENRETLDSFAVITSELRTLAQNLKNSADIFEEKKREKEEELRKLNAARAEAQAAYEAEIERKKVETMMEEKKKQEHALKSSVFAQTEEEQKVVEETVTSAVTTKEIIILQKTEVEEDLPVLMPYVYNPSEESTKDIKKDTQELVLPEPPKFIVPLNDSTIEEGNRFIFQCKLEHGKPKPEIIWYKDGISILNNPDYLTSYDEETGQCILTIEETFAEDSARFMCKAFNTAGFAETGAILKIKETAPEQQLSPPTFIKELLGSVAKKGSPHFLSCRVTGNPLPTVQWFKDNINIEDSSPDYAITYNNGEALLKFIEVLPDDSGVYTCKATNKLGQASTSANLLVEAEIDEKKTVEVIQSNGISSSTPELLEESNKIISKVSFIKEQKIIQESRIIKIESHTEEMGGSVSHIIPDASAQEITTSVNQEEIVVPVKVQTGVVKSPEMPELFEVPELIKPSVQLPLKDVQVFEGNTVRLDCVIIGQPEPEVIWYHDEQPVKESADFQLLFQGDRCSLIIHEAFLDDAGKYKVVAINSQGEISSECVLSVIPSSEAAKQSTVSTAPQFVKLIADVLVSEGEDAVFECQVTGEPKPDLRWYFNNEEIVFVHERITMTHDKTGNCTLKICSTTAEDKGNYVAKAINLIGEAKAIARLVVKPASNESFKREELIPMEEKLLAPSFEESFEDKRVVLQGVSTKFECIVHGKPTPKIQWMFNEKPVHGKSFLVSVSGDRQVLTIPETNQEHVGFISCVAENTKGKATCTTQLDVKGGGGGGEETKATAAKGVEDAKDYFSPLGDDMQASNSSESHLITERKTLPSDQVDESVLTKMSSSYTSSSTTQSSCTKEFKSSTTSSSVITEPQFRPAPGNVVTKTHVESREYSSQENGGPPVVQSHKVEEYEKIVQDSPGQLRQEKTKIVTEGNVALKMQKPARKNVAPRFVSPLTGMIVDQGHDVVLEGVIDGFPTPVITWMKNGQDVKDGVKTTFEHNHVRLELKNVNVRDAGRYTCTAVNDIGNASSTADLVVKKTIFPPVFGKRLQAQVVKKGERVIMEVEITGTPEPTVTWYKDDEPLIDVDGQLKQIGNCYLLIIDAAEKRHAGKYMVHASNAGGEGQSIADFAVFEPTPDTMVEVHKTIVYENVADKNLKLEEKKSELPSAALTAEHIATTTIQPSSTLKTLNPTPSSTSSKIRKIELIGPKSNQHTEEIVEKATRSEMISSTIESHQSETKSEQKFHMKLQHQAPSLFEGDSSTPAAPTVTTTTTKISTHETQKGGEPVTTRTTEFVESKTLEKEAEENENVETATIAKKDALSFFESMSKDSEMTPKGPKAMIKLTEEDKEGNYDVKVDKLTKNYERSTKFEEVKKPIPETLTPAKKSVQDISHKFEAPIITKGVDNVMIDFPYDDYKLPALNIQRAVLEDTTASGSPIHGTLTISRLVAQSESAEKMLSGFNLVPEPPPEIGYMPKPDEEVKKGIDVSSKAKQLQEFQKKSVDAPIGGVKIFPTANAPQKTPQIPETKPKTTYIAPPFDLSEKEFCKKEVVEERCIKKDVHKKEDQEKWWSSTSDLETRSHISTDLSDYRCQSGASSQFEGRPSSPKPSADGIAMEKYWAKSKTTEANRKSWPPPASAGNGNGKETTKTFTKREEWKEPEVGYKTSTHENRDEVEEIPGGGVTKTHIESTSSLETRSWSTRENQISQTVIEEPPKNIVNNIVKAPAPAPKPAPAPAPVTMYKAETTKVDHIVNSMQEKSIMEKYSSECEVKKMESMEKNYEELKAPGLVKAIPSKPVVQLYHSPGDNIKPEPMKTFQESASMFKGTLATAPKRPVVQLYHPTSEPEIILEPGPPPEIGYAPPPNENYERKFERFEKTIEMHKKEDAPPIPPKDARKTPPPLPAKKTEPFSCGNFARGQFIESDYESDFESCKKWRPCESESEEKKYRRVQPPTPRQPRPRSTEPGPPPPSSFEVPPPEVTGPPRPDYLTESLSSCKKSSTMMSRQERSAKQQQHYQNQGFSQDSGVNLPKPGSPPIYVTPEPPKCKSRVFQQESGYMADTDEPFYQREACSLVQKTCGKNEGSSMSSYESKQFMESKSYVSSSSNQRREEMNCVSCPGQTSSCNAPTQQRIYEKSYIPTAPNNNSRCFKNDKEETSYSWSQNQKSSATSPSKFARGEFRESDYESDYEGRIPPLWKPRSESDFEEHHSYKSVKSNLSGKPMKPQEVAVSQSSCLAKKMEFEKLERENSCIRKEDKKSPSKPIPMRQKSVLLPGSPPEIGFAPPRPHSFYEGHSGVPSSSYHSGTVGTEMKKTVRMDESTENTRRIVTVEQTSRVIKFGDNQQSRPSVFKVPTPTKFVQGHFRESDYESDADIGKIKIRPKWAPAESDTDDPHYRKVQPPRSSSVPPPRESGERVVTPMEFDRPPAMAGTAEAQTYEQHLRQLRQESEKFKRENRKSYDCSTLPLDNKKRESKKIGDNFTDLAATQYGFMSNRDMKNAANHVASKHMTDMTSSFKAKTEKFVKEIQSDLKHQSKPILKHPAEKHHQDPDQSQAYREEKRMSQYGTKHIDPDTGLIYFKYDFGYEFGIVLPGESKKTIASSNKTIQGQRRPSDIEVPISHEFTNNRQENGFTHTRTPWQSNNNNNNNNNNNINNNINNQQKKFSPSKFSTGKTVKWEPTSESEFSEAEDSIRRKKRGVMPPPPSLLIPQSPSSPRWDPTTPSPMSLSPSLPSFSPRHSSATTGPPSNVDSIAESPWPNSNGNSGQKEIIQPYLDILPKKAPLFITPLRDIAVVSGQTARFECIVQAEPQPNILWSKDGRIVENSHNYEVYYRNGVCRLVIPCACPSDAGTYVCTATNSLGSTATSSSLQVPEVCMNHQRNADSTETSTEGSKYVTLSNIFTSIGNSLNILKNYEANFLKIEETQNNRLNDKDNCYETKIQDSYDQEDIDSEDTSQSNYDEITRRLEAYSDGDYSYPEFYSTNKITYESFSSPEFFRHFKTPVGYANSFKMKRQTSLNQQQQQMQQQMQQQQMSTMQQQYSQHRSERQITRQQITTQQRVQGELVMTTSPAPVFTGRPGDPSPPIFEQIFKNARFAQGGNAIFDGRVRGNPKPAVSWTHKGAPLRESQKIRMSYDENTGNVTLQINQIGPGDEGEYTCNARNQYGEAICSVYIQPEGFGPPPKQGYKDYQQRYSQTIDKRYTNGSTTTTTVTTEEFKVDTFEYRLLRETEFRESVTRRYVGESDSQVSTTVDRSLGPVAPPQISQKPRNSKLTTWFKDGQRLRDSQRIETIHSNQQATLRIVGTNQSDSGHYTLLAENPQGCTVSSAYLAIEQTDQVDHAQPQYIQREAIKTVETIETTTPEANKALPPNFVRTCADRDVTEGKMTRFDCRVTGRPYPEVTWYINGYPVVNDATHKILVNESGDNSLMITNVTRVDAGTVTCVAKNKAGETSFQCNLNVIEKEQVVAPKFVERFTTTNVKEGEPVVFAARAVDGSGASTLDIPYAKYTDAAWYQCTAQNVAGSTATRARLFVETPKGATPEPRRLNLPRPTKVIEPEPAPGPEVIYLRHVERAKPHLPPAEEDRIYPPPRIIVPLRDVHQIEGGRIHFEARIEPVGDPTMRVDWYVNGRVLEASSRANTLFRFGFISMDLISVVLHDSGDYVCRVVSSTGVAESRGVLSVTPRATIEQTSQHPDSLRYIQQLEDYSKYQRQESIEDQSSQRPVFIRPLQELGELQEGRNAHFEAQLTPVSDPTMKVEWYKDGRPITASSRITTIFNFGYVSLNIMHLRAEDAGSYTVRAVNRMGEAISTASLRVFARTSVTADLGIPEQQKYIEAAEELEAYQLAMHQKYVREEPEPTSPPEFKTPIKDQINIREGGSRITTFFNFGYVALTIKYVTIHDVGIYTCRAYNSVGEAQTMAQMSVISKNDIIYDSQHPQGLQKIQSLEDSSRYQRQISEQTQVTQKPRFLGPLKGTNKIVEGQRAHFEARVEPQSDLSMIIEWYHNGKPITAANRIQTYHDFGYVAIDILQVRSEDAGTYTVIARNALGEARLQATMIVETRSGIDTSSMHRGAYEKTQRLEESRFVEPQYHIEEISKSKPIFVQPLSDPKPVSEGKNIHLECRLEPMGDPTMRVEWFQNGRPITIGSRFRTYYDFGFVALDIVGTTVLDSGEFTVRATNHLGSAHTSACVRVIGRSDVVTESQNEQSLEQIQMLEDSSKYRRHVQEDVTVVQAPQFTRALRNIETVELTNVHLECRLQPVGDPTMRVEWFVNGMPVTIGHRFRPSYEFDYVAMEILGVNPEDSGVYTCQARNQLGEAVTSGSVRVRAKKDLILESQHPEGLERIQYLEDASRYKRKELIDEVVNIKPKFVTSPKNQEELLEGEYAHFECKLEPVTDPNLKDTVSVPFMISVTLHST
ncbi:Similar to sls: Titin (Drosophila melanogaster) [Cotesia congregata]|uniref:Similar to sls: Titin (Drosophila melanogaster) n=1 Tax=Cotesia congregata TaxID=51543 RepID=A0A8J2H7A5_COTCN|nr:Similar to sls: Titin (Drosophila melanogaster) [Cotesia congregata]